MAGYELDSVIKALESIGLTTSESRVYLALLKLGASKTGPIVNEAGIASSKIYDVLERLMQKGLASYFVRDNVKYYKAAPPASLFRYLAQKRKEIEMHEMDVRKILPFLTMIENEKEEKLEATVFKGPKGVRTAFTNLVEEISEGGEVHVMGVYPFGKSFLRHALYFQKIRSRKNITGKFLINRDAKNIAEEFSRYPPVEIRFLPEGITTPAIFLIYNDRVIINLAKELTFFVLKSSSAKEAFDAYFSMLWQGSELFKPETLKTETF